MKDLEQHLLNDFQRDLPLTPRPFAVLGERLGVSERKVLETLQQLREEGMISRVGAVFRPGRIGVSTLAAMAVPPERLTMVADLVSGYQEVNHNYEREHHFNLWFVVTAADGERLEHVLADIEQDTGFSLMSLPLEQEYHIDLGFPLELP